MTAETIYLVEYVNGCEVNAYRTREAAQIAILKDYFKGIKEDPSCFPKNEELIQELSSIVNDGYVSDFVYITEAELH